MSDFNTKFFTFKEGQKFISTEYRKCWIIRTQAYARKDKDAKSVGDFYYAMYNETTKKPFKLSISELEYHVNTLTYIPLGKLFEKYIDKLDSFANRELGWQDINDWIVTFDCALSKKLIPDSSKLQAILKKLSEQESYVGYKKSKNESKINSTQMTLQETIKRIIKEEISANEYAKFYNMSNDTNWDQNTIPEYESFTKKLFGKSGWVPADVTLALKHFKKVKDFVDYMMQSGKEDSKLLMPRTPLNKSQAEMDDFKKTYGK